MPLRCKTSRSFGFVHIGLALVIGSFASCGAKDASFPPGDAAELSRWLDEERLTPAELIDRELETGRSLVFVQDEVLRADSVELMRSLLPSLHAGGVRDVGLFFLEAQGQEDVDAYLREEPEEPPKPEGSGAGAGNPAAKLLFAADASLGYREYCDFITYVKDFNSGLAPEETPLRLIALGSAGTLSSEIAGGLLNPSLNEESGIPRALTAQLPVFLWVTEQGLPGLPTPSETEGASDDASGIPQSPALLAHFGPGSEGLRHGGLVEKTVSQRDIRDRSFSFRPTDEPFAGWFTGPDGFEADIVVVTHFPYRAVTPIEDFISPARVAEARPFFPDIGLDNLPGLQANRMNGEIRRTARRYRNRIKRIILPE